MARLESSPATGGAQFGPTGPGVAGLGGDGLVVDAVAPSPRGGRRRPVRLSVYVLVLALGMAIVAPAAAFLAYVLDQQSGAQQRQLRERGTQLAGEIADRLEQELESMGTMLAVFASSGWLEADELEPMHRRASRALAGTGRHLIVLDESLDQLINTRVAFGTPLGKTSDRETAEAVLETGMATISDIFIGGVADAPVFNALRPVSLADGRERVLIMTRNAATLGDLIGSQKRDDTWSFVVLDGSGDIVTGNFGGSATAPGAAGGEFPPACVREIPGPMPPRSEGDPATFLRLLSGTSWRVCAWSEPGAAVPEGGGWTTVLTAAAAWIGAAVLVAVLLSMTISRSIARTARIGALLGSGREVPYVPSTIAEVDVVRRTLADAGAERVRHDRRLELLLREAAHRARNQIALAVSLVDLSARGVETAAELKKDVKGRLIALGRSVDALTDKAPDTARLENLVAAQLAPFVDDGGERLRTDGDGVLISERAAQSLSLVLHELATNASKYGAWTQPDGVVSVQWKLADDALVLDWTEAGVFSEATEHQGFGTTLMQGLVESGLGGRMDRSFGEAGFRCRMVLPRDQITPQDALA